jgi:hypothetical protein
MADNAGSGYEVWVKYKRYSVVEDFSGKLNFSVAQG